MGVIADKVMAFSLAAILCGPAASQSPERKFDLDSTVMPVAEAGSGTAAQDRNSAIQKESARASAPAGVQGPVSSKNSSSLSILVLVGDRAINSIPYNSGVPLVVEVRDERNLPVEGAEVVFQLPSVGPSGFFPGQQLTWTGKTDLNGQAVAPSYIPNQQKGRFGVQVTARYAGNGGRALVAQTNSVRSRESGRSRWWKLAIVAVACGAAGGIVWATHRESAPQTVTLQPGSVSIGGPR